MIVVALAISFTSYLGQFEQTTTLSSPSSNEMFAIQSPVLGSESASITIVEVGDYQCEMCKHWFDNTRQQVIDNYIDRAGGLRDTADISNIYIIFPNGESSPVSRRSFNNKNPGLLVPGSTIVIPRDPRPFDWLVMSKTVAPIFANLATSAAAIAAINAVSNNYPYRN